MNAVSDTFQEARELQWVWKSPAMRAMVVAICRVALAKGAKEFSALDLPLESHGGRGIAGSIFHRLAKDRVICPACVVADGAPMQKTVKNAGGNRIGLWRLENRGRAEALLQVDEVLPSQTHYEQPELAGVA